LCQLQSSNFSGLSVENEGENSSFCVHDQQACDSGKRNDHRFRNFLNFSRIKIVVAAIITEPKSVISLLPRTKTAPIIVPIAAAVTRSTKPLTDGCLPYFLKY
jgi:hypothetical protein